MKAIMKRLLLSVIIPVYNGAEFLAAAVASVRAQVYSPLEVIIVDDGSTDRTAQVVQALGADLRYVYQSNQGPATARNRGLALARGQLITFLDADDLWPAHKLAQQVAVCNADSSIDVVWGTTQIVPYCAAETAPPLAPTWRPLLGSMVCRREIFAQIGRFEPTLRFGEDIDWLMRAQEQQLNLRKVPVPALIYRLRPGSMTYDKTLNEVGWFDNLRRGLHRRRAARKMGATQVTTARGTAVKEVR
jgi:glycosyltransferase involved in cell wall biosynthesis